MVEAISVVENLHIWVTGKHIGWARKDLLGPLSGTNSSVDHIGRGRGGYKKSFISLHQSVLWWRFLRFHAVFLPDRRSWAAQPGRDQEPEPENSVLVCPRISDAPNLDFVRKLHRTRQDRKIVLSRSEKFRSV